MSDPEPFRIIADRLEAIARDCFDIGVKEKLRLLAEELDPGRAKSPIVTRFRDKDE